MALRNIDIDDRNFEQLLVELKQHIPVSQWTDHNPSDPGIMLLELFAWLGEMTLYQMNRVPGSHREKFLKLIIDPPEPVTIDVQLDYELEPDREDKLVIPTGIRFATDFKNGTRYIFETYKETIIPAPLDAGDPTGTITVNARTWKKITGEEVGVSDESPDQTFSLKEPFVLLDFVNDSPTYRFNPVVSVDGVAWKLKQFLLTEESQTVNSKHVMVDEFENTVRFGDGTFADIPPDNAAITCSYQVLQGPEALIKADELKHILDDIPGLDPDNNNTESITISGNKDALGGFYFVKKEERFARGLENFKEPFRLITAADFERALLADFNKLQQLTRKNDFNELSQLIKEYDIIKLKKYEQENKLGPILDRFGAADYPVLMDDYFNGLPESLFKICRATALMNRLYNKTNEPPELIRKTGHVTILVIPEFKEAGLKNKDYIEVHNDLEDKILRFLDNKRLITTRLHIMPAKLKKIEIKINAVIFKELSTAEMKETIRKQVSDFMDILNGGFDQKGWLPGRNLYKSHLYRLVEGIEGIDYVKSLTFGTSAAGNYIEIEENELPLLLKDNLFINVERN